MFFKHVFTPGLSIHSYLLGDEKTQQCIVIDPTRHVISYIIQAQDAGFDITHILETHVHADFISGAKELKHALNEKPAIYCSGMGGEEWIPRYTDHIVNEKTEIILGDIKIKAIHTPGHTPEHVIWLCYDQTRSAETPWFAFTGDCVFVGSVGRPDLLGKEKTEVLARQLYQTLFHQLEELPDFVEIFPAHGGGSLCGKSLSNRTNSTLGYERSFNPYLQKQTEKEWTQHLLKRLSDVPAYFQRVKKLNQEGPKLLCALKRDKWKKEESPDLSKLFLIDIRHPEAFASSHLKHSLNLFFPGTFRQWAGWFIPEETPIGIVLESTQMFAEAADFLRLMGFDQDIWMIEWKEGESYFSDLSTSLTMIEVEQLKTKASQFYTIDIRSPEEWTKGHIQHSQHFELEKLPSVLEDIPKEKTVALICKSGNRSSLGASYLKKQGRDAVNVRGGIQAWKQAEFPLEV